MTRITQEIIDKIVEQQTKIADILGYFEKPLLKNKLEKERLRALELRLMNLGYRLPESYKEFLSISDGIAYFSCSFSLLGYDVLISDEYETELCETLSSGIGYEYDKNDPPLLIGKSDETNTKVFYEFAHERQISEEPVIMEGEPGFMSMHPSFHSFLECRVDANEKTIKHLLENKHGFEQ